MSRRVSLTELIAAGVRLTPAEAAAIVSDVCRQQADGRLRGIPSAHVIRISEDGRVTAEGPVNADGPVIECAAQLLDGLVRDRDAPPEFRMPGGLRLALARGLRQMDLPPFGSLDEFAASVERFAAPDLPTVARELFKAWEGVSHPAAVPAPVETDDKVEAARELTISDVRRARRATGLTLDDISDRSRIPAALLRELEWGYLRNWPDGRYARAQVIRYARAAGLDDEMVLRVVEPMLDEASATRAGTSLVQVPAEQSIEALVPLDPPGPIVTTEEIPLAPEPLVFPSTAATPRRSRGWLAAVAVAALLLGLIPAAWRLEQAFGPSSLDRFIPALPSSIASVTEDVQSAVSAPAAPAMQVRRVTYAPSFANIGTAVFYHAPTDGGGATAPPLLQVTRIADDGATNLHAQVSADGSRVAFDSDRDGERGVYVADADGQHVRLVSGDGFAALPSWSPRGDRLAFVKGESDNPDVWNLWTVDLATGMLTRRTSFATGQLWGASWFPDGSRLAYGHSDRLVILDLASDTPRTFRTPVPGHAVRGPSVSPDGTHIIFQVKDDGAWLMDVDSGRMRRALDDPGAEAYTWAPDGDRVAFYSSRLDGWGVWALTAAGTRGRQSTR